MPETDLARFLRLSQGEIRVMQEENAGLRATRRRIRKNATRRALRARRRARRG